MIRIGSVFLGAFVVAFKWYLDVRLTVTPSVSKLLFQTFTYNILQNTTEYYSTGKSGRLLWRQNYLIYYDKSVLCCDERSNQWSNDTMDIKGQAVA